MQTDLYESYSLGTLTKKLYQDQKVYKKVDLKC